MNILDDTFYNSNMKNDEIQKVLYEHISQQLKIQKNSQILILDNMCFENNFKDNREMKEVEKLIQDFSDTAVQILKDYNKKLNLKNDMYILLPFNSMTQFVVEALVQNKYFIC